MAEQATSTVAAAVIGGITDRALTRVVRTLQAPAAAAHEKLLRLELLVLKVRSAIEVSEKHPINSRSLLGWRDKLKEAAAEGGEILLHFQRRAMEDGAEAASSAADRQQSAGGSALYFARSSLSGMARRVRDAARRLFSTDENTKKLDTSLEKMELVSRDMAQFVTLLQLEVSRIGRRPAKRRAPPSPPRDVDEISDWELLSGSDSTTAEPVSKETPVAPAAEAEDRGNEASISALLGVKATDDRDVEGFGWLAQWAAVLRDAVERGADVCEAGLGADDELHSFARVVDWLSSEIECFSILASLCPLKLWDFR